MEPNLERIQLWVDALRSDQFVQGRKALSLRSEDGDFRFCCLGVACEVAIANGLDVDTKMIMRQKRYDEESWAMPESVMKWYGLEENDPWLPTGEYGAQDIASVINDDYGWDFHQIAQAIETRFNLREEESHGRQGEGETVG